MRKVLIYIFAKKNIKFKSHFKLTIVSQLIYVMTRMVRPTKELWLIWLINKCWIYFFLFSGFISRKFESSWFEWYSWSSHWTFFSCSICLHVINFHQIHLWITRHNYNFIITFVTLMHIRGGSVFKEWVSWRHYFLKKYLFLFKKI